MTLFLVIIFWISTLLLLHTYVLYPLYVIQRSKGKELNSTIYKPTDNWPQVSILMAAYNEDQILDEKIESILSQTYDMDKLQIYIASDKSTDRTNEILTSYGDKYDNIHIFLSPVRKGKPGLINHLEKQAQSGQSISEDHIYILTDANVILDQNAITEMVKHFKNKEIGLVDARMIYQGLDKKGIAEAENNYLSIEVHIKQGESLLWKRMVGPFGGCYALRSTLYSPVPENHLVDDFYIAMKSFEAGSLAINAMDAQCYESVSHQQALEYRRKKRISSGNWQNLFAFAHLLNPFTILGFALVSHKVLRWIGPFLIINVVVGASLLGLLGSSFYTCIAWGLILTLVGIPILDLVLSKINLHIGWIRSLRYFVIMNIALLHGFVSYLGGIKSGVWQPTRSSV